MKKQVSFYIPCYNAQRTLEKTIRSVLNQTYPVREFFIVDDGSTDGSIDIASDLGIPIIRHKENLGLAAARNTALRNSHYPFIASIDSDVEIESGWLERIMGNFVHSSIAGVSGRLLEKFTLTAVDRWRQVHLSQDKGKKKIATMPYLIGAASCYRVSALKKAKGFNHRYRTNFEDYDMGVRLNKMGWTLAHDPGAKARHLRIDDIYSLLNTYRSWSLPFHNFEKRLESISGIQAQIGFHHIRNNRKLFEEDLRHRRFHLLYPSFLLMFTETLKDVDRFIESHPPYAPLFPLVAGIIFEELHDNPIIPSCLSRATMKDLSRHVSNLPAFRKKNQGAPDIRKLVKRRFPHLDPLMRTSISATLEILRSALKARLAEINRDTFSQILTSANEISYEQKNSPYKNRREFRVLLANPPWKQKGWYGVRAGSRWPHMEPFDPRYQAVPDYLPFPFFLAYSVSLLKRLKGVAPWIMDSIAEGMDEETFLERVRGFSPHLIVIETSAASSANDVRLTRKVKKLSAAPIKVVFVGPHVTSLNEGFLLENPDIVDYIILGEYELSLEKLTGCLARNQEPSDVPGILYWKEKQLVGDGKSAPLVHLDSLPLPERLTLPIYNYRDRFAGMPELSGQMMASRGCPYQCIFCCWPQTLYADQSYRFVDPGKVAKEMKMLVDDFGFRAIYFDDDTFNIGKSRLLRLCSEIKKREIQTPWAIMARGDTSDRKTFEAMKAAGLHAIKFGVESGSQELVNNSGKNLDLKKVMETVRICKNLEIKTHLTFAFGLPGETTETIRGTVDFALETDPDSAQFSILTPFPGTKFFDMLERNNNLVTKEWTKYDGTHSTVFQTEHFSPEDLERATEEARELFNRKRMERVNHKELSYFARLLKEGRSRIGLFPAGLHSRMFLEKYSISPKDRVFFFDNDRGKIGGKVCGIEVFSPNRMEALSLDFILIIHPAFEEEMYFQVRHLERTGVKIMRIFGEK